MQSENRIFDDAAKIVCKIVKSFCKITRRVCKTKPQQSQSHQNKDVSEVKKKDK